MSLNSDLMIESILLRCVVSA